MKQTDVCIIGAGPGGATAALHLAKSGVPCVLLDKAAFPRDKICGDALSGKVINELKRIDGSLLPQLHTQATAIGSGGIHFIAPNEKWLTIPFHPESEKFPSETVFHPGYLMKRLDFDDFLIGKVRENAQIDLREGEEVTGYQRIDGGWELTTNRQTLRAKLLIIANGAQSNFTRHVAGIVQEPGHFCAGLRAYYQGVAGLDANGFIELHFLKDFLPGYFWIFPLAGGHANVGVGMLSSAISRKRVNLKNSMLEIIQTHPVLRQRFANARLVGNIKGYGLPLGSKKRPLSGDNYMLTGDAAHLIDPFTGEGISNAMISGRWAADQVVKCLAANDFSAAFMRQYDAAVYRRLGRELQISRRMQQLLRYPSLFNLVVSRANRNPALQQLLSAMFMDMDLRAALKKPSFYARLLFS